MGQAKLIINLVTNLMPEYIVCIYFKPWQCKKCHLSSGCQPLVKIHFTLHLHKSLRNVPVTVLHGGESPVSQISTIWTI